MNDGGVIKVWEGGRRRALTRVRASRPGVATTVYSLPSSLQPTRCGTGGAILSGTRHSVTASESYEKTP